MYYSGNDVDIYAVNLSTDNSRLIDAVSIQFTINHPTAPIYSHSSRTLITQMQGTKVIHGALSVNQSSYNDIPWEFDNGVFNSIRIEYSKEQYDRLSEYKGFSYFTYYELIGIEIVSEQHLTTPTPDNIVNNYQFIARTFEAKDAERTPLMAKEDGTSRL